MKSKVSIQTLNQLTQNFSEIDEKEFEKDIDAVSYFYDQILDAMQQGFLPIYENSDHNGYIERHFGNGNVTVMITLDLCGDQGWS